VSHRAVVVGGGIAGLAASIALLRTGWHVTILERAARFEEVGAGFAMTPNAVAAFRGLGFSADEVEELGHRTRAGGTYDTLGRPILRIPDTPELREATALVGVHRQRLHSLMLRRARDLGAELHSVSALATLEVGEAGGPSAVANGLEADLVVGADGMNSAVRSLVFPGAALRYSGYSSWRAIVPRGEESELIQYWGPHAEFGVLPVSDSETYWYGYVAMPEGMPLRYELGSAARFFDSWGEPVRQTIARTAPDALLRHDVYYLPRSLPRLTAGRVALIGDAAHGFLPTMGQGAATALEDGLCVGLLIGEPVGRGADLADSLGSFHQARAPRVRALAQASLASGRIGAHLGPGYRQKVRNWMMSKVPPSLLLRASRAAMSWVPPV